MRKILLILLSALSLTALAQQPDWYDDNSRAFNYPTKHYFVGFATDEKRNNESLEAAMSRMKNAARVEAASTIRVYVQNTTNINGLSRTLESMEGSFYQSVEEFSSRTKTSVEMEIPGLQIDAWRNPQTGEIAAFAYVKKSTLIRQLEKKITVGLTKIETSMDQIDQLVANGQKMQARELAEKTVPQFREVDETQKLLAAVDEDADEESLQLQETRTLQHRLTGLVAQLKNGINIYLSCVALTLNGRYDALEGKIKGALSPLGCTFVSRVDQSDWAIYVSATTREHDFKGGNMFFVYVDAKIDITKTATKQHIFTEHLNPEKGGNANSYEAAAREAYKEVTPKIITAIKEQIQQ